MKVGIEMKDSYITSDLPKFAIDVQPLKETTDEPSIMLQYLSQVAMVERYEEGDWFVVIVAKPRRHYRVSSAK